MIEAAKDSGNATETCTDVPTTIGPPLLFCPSAHLFIIYGLTSSPAQRILTHFTSLLTYLCSLSCSLNRASSTFIICFTHSFSPLPSTFCRLPAITSGHMASSCKSLQHKPIPTQQYGHWHSLHSTQQHAAQQHPPATPKSNSAPNMQTLSCKKTTTCKTPATLTLPSEPTYKKQRTKKRAGRPFGQPAFILLPEVIR